MVTQILSLLANVLAGPGTSPPLSSAMASDDVAAVRSMAAGDRDAVASLYDRHARAVFSLALRIVRDQQDAEEVVQEVFAQAWRSAGRFDTGRGAVVAWLLMMTRSRAIDRVRARRGDGKRVGDDDFLAQMPDVGMAPDLSVLTSERVSHVRAALAALPLMQRMAIEMAFYEGLSHHEVAERLEQPLGTVKTRIRLGLLKLREALAGGTA